MLAHKAVHEGKVAAEVISGMPSAFTPMSIPSVAYTTLRLLGQVKPKTSLRPKALSTRRAHSHGRLRVVA
jgi:dihydrolipoamide dehydrogenase